MGWATKSNQTYQECITRLLEKLKELFNDVEGSYFLFWVDNCYEKRVGCSYTAHYGKILRDPSVTRGIKEHFAIWCKPPGERVCDPSLIKWLNPWLINYQAEHLITMVPRALERTETQLNRSRRDRMKTILKIVQDLCEFCEIPFIFYYNFVDRNRPARPYACPPDATPALFNSEFFKELINPNNLDDIPRLDYMSPVKKARLFGPRPMPGQLRQARSSARLDFSNEERADDPATWLDTHFPPYYPEAPVELDWVKQHLIELRLRPEYIEPTVIANSEDALQVVMHDSGVNAEGIDFVAKKLVLVSMVGFDDPTFECTCPTFHAYANEEEHDCAHCILLEHEEEYFRGKEVLESPDEQGGIFPILNKSGVLVAYVSDDEVVSVEMAMGKRTLCCGRNGDGKRCGHVFRVKEYEEKHGIYSWSAAKLASEDNGTGAGDPMAFIDNHPCLPLHLERKPNECIRKAIINLHMYGCMCFPAPPMSINRDESFSDDAGENGKTVVETRAMFPPLPVKSCKCGQRYQNSGYTRVNKKCAVYLEWPRCYQNMALYCLDCPNADADCRVHYDGTNDGLFLFSNQTAIALKLLYDSVDAFKGSGHSPHAFCIIKSEEYNGAYKAWDSPQPFMAENTWRQAFYLFLHCIHTNNVVFSCPCCGDSPKTLIADGIRLLINSNSYHGQDITAPGVAFSLRPPDHKRHARSFIDSRAGTHKRQEMQGLLVKFAEHVKKGGAAAPTADASEGGTSGSGMTDEAIDGLIQRAAVYQLDDFLSWVRVKLCAGSLQGKDKTQLADFIEKCLATESCVLKYLPYKLLQPMVDALESGVLGVSLLAEIDEDAPLLRHVLRIGGAGKSAPFTVPWPDPQRPGASPFYSMLHEMCLRTELCGKGAGEEELDLCAMPETVVEQSLPSAGTKECLRTGICTGLRQIRHRPRFAADGKQQSNETGCRHEFLGGAEKTGGVMTVFCGHGVCYAAFIIPKAEGRDELFSFIIKYLRKAPDILVYDFGCAFQEYCLNRLPGFFKFMLVFIDRTHWPGHKTCTLAYNLSTIKRLNHLNSQAAEQCNSVLRVYERSLSRMSQVPFMLALRLVLDSWNRSKTEELNSREAKMREARRKRPRRWMRGQEGLGS